MMVSLRPILSIATKIELLTILFLIPAAGWSQDVHHQPGQYAESLIDGNRHRNYILHLPPQYGSQKDLPLVLAFHGGGGNALQLLDSCGLAAKADKEGFILVAPNGTGRLRKRFLTWNVGFGFGYAMRNHIDDIGFVRKLIEKLEDNLKIDPRRIFATGISNGGILCHFLAGALSNKISAIAPVVACIGGKKKLSEPFIYPSTPEKPVSVIAFNGLLDQHIPYQGGIQQKSVAKPAYVTAADDMHSFWVKANKCRPQPRVEVNHSDQYKVITYRGGLGGSEVVQYVIFNQGHAWPGGKKPWAGADPPSTMVSANDVMWTFFKNHPRK
ncbi:MAG: PHB depolymerase family esterase [Desulfobacterales bacterium]|jgi:polyhydroxybutyrate depolymerase